MVKPASPGVAALAKALRGLKGEAVAERMSQGVLPWSERSVASKLSTLPAGTRRELLAQLTDEEARALRWEWGFWARPSQRPPPGDWFIWLLTPGRGFGKTRTGAEWVHSRAMAGDERREIMLIAATPADARDDMIEGPAGILNVAPPKERPTYEPSNRRLTWPTGARARIRSGAEPEGVRGFSGDTAWCDELAAWKYPKGTWDNLMFGLREAKVEQPRVCVTTTPKPLGLLKDLIERSETNPHVVHVGGSSYENRENLSDVYYRVVIEPYEGTRVGKQEIYGQLLSEDPRAHWSRKLIDDTRAKHDPLDYVRVVVAVDPQGNKANEEAETGIVVVGLGPQKHGYVLADASGRYSPSEWGGTAIRLYQQYRASCIVGERNFGGDMVENTIHAINATVPFREVYASRGKMRRAEPIATLYERGLVHHLGTFSDLEDQMCTYVQGEKKQPSPDRMDALVWALWELMIEGRSVGAWEVDAGSMGKSSAWSI